MQTLTVAGGASTTGGVGELHPSRNSPDANSGAQIRVRNIDVIPRMIDEREVTETIAIAKRDVDC